MKPETSLKRWTTKMIFSAMVLLPLLHCQAQDFTESQNRVKAIYLYNFVKNIEWSAESATHFKICLLKKDHFYTDLEKMVATKKKGNKNIVVEEISAPDKCVTCDLVFLEELHPEPITKRDQHCPSLVVTAGFYEKSFSDIALLYSDKKLNFSINTELCTKNGFKIPSQFMLLANQKLIE